MGKLLKRSLSVLICALMIVTLTTTHAFADNSVNATNLIQGSVFELGLYPQSRVTDQSTLNALNSIPCEMKSYGYIKDLDDDGSYDTVDMTYADIAYNNKAYRKVTINEFRPLYADDNEKSDGEILYQNINGYSYGTYYFLWEPIIWTVLANQGPSSDILVMSQRLLDSPYYHQFYDETLTWETSSLKSWFDNTFIDMAFSDNEKPKLKTVHNTNDPSPWPDANLPGGNPTDDTVWVLSYKELTTGAYGFLDGDPRIDADRKATGTDYAKCQGLHVGPSDGPAGEIGYSVYWMRNPGYYAGDGATTLADGSLAGASSSYVSAVGVRPVFRLDYNSVLTGADTLICRITGHDYQEVSSVPATCTEAGSVSYKCSRCDATKTDTIPATGHSYGDPSWNWTGFDSAAATFTCSVCQHCETVDATVTHEAKDDNICAKASVQFNNNTYTDEKTFDYFAGHSLLLNGSIGVCFYVNLTDRQMTDGATVDFSWTVNDNEKTGSVTLTPDDKTECGYKATCPIAVAEMTYDITATLSVGGSEIKTDDYSVVEYSDVILTDDAFAANYIAAENDKGNNGSERLAQLRELVKTMLDYGAKAQVAFSRDPDHPANAKLTADDPSSPYYYAPSAVTANMIDTGASDMSAGLEAFGLEYEGTTIVYLSDTSIRHYYKVKDKDKFGAIKDGIAFSGSPVGYKTKGGSIYFELKNIASSKLDDLFILNIGVTDYKYSVLDYVKACLNSDTVRGETKELAAATYRYSRASGAYFNR